MDNSTENKQNPEALRCKNCDELLYSPAKFCSACGQRNFDGRVRLRDLVGKFFAGLWHLDNKFLKTCREIMVPARVTIRYFQGKIDRYHHPIQFFFIVMFFFLLLFNKLSNSIHLNNTSGNFSLQVENRDTVDTKMLEKELAKRGLFPLIEDYVRIQEYRAAYTLLPDSMRTGATRVALDSIIRAVEGDKERVVREIFAIQNGEENGPLKPDSLELTFFTTTVRVDLFDLIKYDPEEIIARYQLTRWEDRVAIRQGIKSVKNPTGLIQQYVGSFGWAIFVLVAFMALVQYVLYWKTKRYYVEHFVFVIHQQSAAYLLLTLCLFIQQYCLNIKWLWLLGMLWIVFSLPVAMKRFYGYSWGWTIGLSLLYALIYFFALVVLFVATLLVVFLLF